MAFAVIVPKKREKKEKQMLSPDPCPYVDKTLHSSKLSVRSSLPTPESPAEPLQLHLPILTPLQGSHKAEAQTSEQRPE